MLLKHGTCSGVSRGIFCTVSQEMRSFLSSSRSLSMSLPVRNGLKPKLSKTNVSHESLSVPNLLADQRRRIISWTYIPSLVTMRYVPLAWKFPSICPSPSTCTLPKMSSGLQVEKKNHQ